MLDAALQGKHLKRGDWKVSELVKICKGVNLPNLPLRNDALVPAAAICSGLNDWIAGTTSPNTQCTVCDEHFPSNERLETHCRHLIDYCAVCMEGWLSTQLDFNKPDAIRCPADGCAEMLSPEDIEGYLPFEEFGRFKMRYFATLFGGFVCPTKDCGTAISQDDELSFIKCGGCKHRICMSCHGEWHSGVTCDQHQADLAERAAEQAKEDERLAREREEERLVKEAEERLRAKQAGEESASTQYKEAKTMSCPGCKAPTVKEGGCDHMICSTCRLSRSAKAILTLYPTAHCETEFCYECGTSYKAIRSSDNSAHERSCRHWRANPGPATLRRRRERAERQLRELAERQRRELAERRRRRDDLVEYRRSLLGYAVEVPRPRPTYGAPGVDEHRAIEQDDGSAGGDGGLAE